MDPRPSAGGRRRTNARSYATARLSARPFRPQRSLWRFLVIPANAGVQRPRPAGAASLDTRFRGYDNVGTKPRGVGPPGADAPSNHPMISISLAIRNYNSAFLGSPTMNSRVPGST